jgi:hypothetical protein
MQSDACEIVNRTYHQLDDAAVVLSTKASGRARSSSGAPRRQAIPALAHSPQDTPVLEYPDTTSCTPHRMTAAARLTDPTATRRHACFQSRGEGTFGGGAGPSDQRLVASWSIARTSFSPHVLYATWSHQQKFDNLAMVINYFFRFHSSNNIVF